ncbi:hypothetical protein EC970010_2308B, partial [Escherichia coli 97.0010]
KKTASAVLIIHDCAARLSASSSAANGSTSGLSSSSPQQSMASFSATFIPCAPKTAFTICALRISPRSSPSGDILSNSIHIIASLALRLWRSSDKVRPR